jgi:hypothetical protein
MRGFGTAMLAALLLAPASAGAQETGKPDLSQIPQKVMAALKAKFPAADIHQWTKETENGVVLYDMEFTQEGRKFEADIKESGVIENWEKAIAAQELPAAVTLAVEKKYPRSTLSEVMAVTAVKDGKDALEGYEITLKTAAGKGVEVTLAPDGKVLEEGGVEK